MASRPASLSPTERCLSAACYLGLAPLIRLWRSPVSNQFLGRHYAQAMATGFIALVWLLLDAVFEAGETFLLIRFPGFAQPFINQFEPFLTYALLLPLIVLAGLWLTSLALALVGSIRAVPLLKGLACRPRVVRVCFALNSIALAFVPIFIVLTVHATSLTRTSRGNAVVYFLYDEGIPVPSWGYALGLYRISLEAERRWGKGCVVLDRLNKQSLHAALAHGKVLILATHGGDGYACTYYAPEKLGVGPPETGAIDERKSSHFLRTSVFDANNKPGAWENVAVNNGLRLVYLFGCNAGTKAAQWQEHLAPARVITYNRESTVFDHAFWFAIEGPAQLRQLP